MVFDPLYLAENDDDDDSDEPSSFLPVVCVFYGYKKNYLTCPILFERNNSIHRFRFI